MKGLPPEPPSSEITPEALYRSRREFIKNGALTLGTSALVGGSLVWLAGNGPPQIFDGSVPRLAAPEIDQQIQAEQREDGQKREH